MFKISTPSTEAEFQRYYQFRWEMLRKPWNYPLGSEKDEYEQVSQHRMILDDQGQPVAIGRVHLNTSEEAQIRHIAVAKHMQRKGAGKFIVQALEQIAQEQGVTRLVTNSRDSSIAFFASLGFTVDQEAPSELGKLHRQQMVKNICPQQLRLHPKWCDELQSTWHDAIPISEQMGIKLHQYSGHTLEVRASLNKNINLHGTMFAGSIFSLATLTAWGMIFLQLKQRGLQGDIVLGDADIHYHKPITDKPRALCHLESITGSYERLEANKKCCFQLQVDILDSQKPVAEFKGVFWVLPPKNAS